MLTFSVAVPLARRPLNVVSASTNLGTSLPLSGVCGVRTEACVVSPTAGSAPPTPQPTAIVDTPTSSSRGAPARTVIPEEGGGTAARRAIGTSPKGVRFRIPSIVSIGGLLVGFVTDRHCPINQRSY